MNQAITTGASFESARSAIGVVTDRPAAWLPAIQARIAAREDWMVEGREWAQVFAFDTRPVQLVGVVMSVGTVYPAIWGRFAQSAPDAPEIVAARVAPVGTLNLGPGAASRIADESDANRSPAASID
jgi:hypothetical protein